MLTWSDVCVPTEFVRYLTSLAPCATLDRIIHRIVFNQKSKVRYRYFCNKCDYIYNQSGNEEISRCLNCNNKSLTAEAAWRDPKDMPAYTRRRTNIESFILTMKNNYIATYGELPINFIDCGWGLGMYGGVYCQFHGGDKVYDASHRMSIMKAAMLCPYLWQNVPISMFIGT